MLWAPVWLIADHGETHAAQPPNVDLVPGVHHVEQDRPDAVHPVDHLRRLANESAAVLLIGQHPLDPQQPDPAREGMFGDDAQQGDGAASRADHSQAGLAQQQTPQQSLGWPLAALGHGLGCILRPHRRGHQGGVGRGGQPKVRPHIRRPRA